MTIAAFRKELAELLKDYLKDYNFKLIKGDTDGYSLVHENEELLLMVRFQKMERANGMEIGVGTDFIQFKKVEEIWHPIMLQHKMYTTATPPVSYDLTFRNYGDSGKDWHQRLIANLINTKEDVIKYAEVLKGFLEAVSFPWFQRYNNLASVNEFIKSMDESGIAYYFTPPHFFRILIIKGLGKDETYDSYLQHWKQSLNASREQGDERYVPYCAALDDLEKVLQTK